MSAGVLDGERFSGSMRVQRLPVEVRKSSGGTLASQARTTADATQVAAQPGSRVLRLLLVTVPPRLLASVHCQVLSMFDAPRATGSTIDGDDVRRKYRDCSPPGPARGGPT